MRSFSLVLFAFILCSSCSKFQFPGNFFDDDSGKTRRGGNQGQVDFGDVEDIDFEGIIEASKDVKLEKCVNYNGGALSLFGKGLLDPIKNCLSKYLDKSVGKICEKEELLDELEDQYSDNDEALEEIDAMRVELEEIKFEVTDNLLIAADEMDALHADIEDNIDEIGESFIRSALRTFTNSEIGGFTRFFERKAFNLCGYAILEKYKKEKE